MPLTAFCRIVFLALVALCAADGQNDPQACADSGNNMFLQLAVQVDTEENELQKLVSLLLLIRKECMRGTEACLPALTELRSAVWPRVESEGNFSSPPWMPGAHFDHIFLADSQSISESGTKTMFFRHIFKAGGLNIYANLQQVTMNFRRLSYLEFCRKFHSTDPANRTAFTFVRHPISRFVSGYAEIEYRTRVGIDWPSMDFMARKLKGYPVGSHERLAVFFEEFLRSGIKNDGHVRPQVEFLLPNVCSFPMGLVGKTERMEEDWAKMFGIQNRTGIEIDSELAVHSHGDRDKDAMESFLGWGSAKRSSNDGASAPNRHKYVRVLCWLYLADFVIFEYELPDECQQEPMQSAIALVRKASAHSFMIQDKV